MRKIALISGLLPFALGGCISLGVSRTAERFPSKPKDCAVDFQHGDMSKATRLMQQGAYVQVGNITAVDAPEEYTESLKDKLRPEVCHLGGDLVLMNYSSSQPGGRYTDSFMVMHSTETATR